MLGDHKLHFEKRCPMYEFFDMNLELRILWDYREWAYEKRRETEYYAMDDRKWDFFDALMGTLKEDLWEDQFRSEEWFTIG